MAEIGVPQLAVWLAKFADDVTKGAEYLTELDSAIGDADHGSNMARGMAAVAELSPADYDTPSAYLKKAGMTLVSTVGGASGPLYGTFLLRWALVAGDGTSWDIDAAYAGFEAGVSGIAQRGKATEGEKTMLDALLPALRAFDEHRADGWDAAWSAARTAAEQGRDATVDMLATKGRASYLGERSVGHQDPGATSATMLVSAAAAKLVP